MSEEVSCPHVGCPAKLNVKGGFFRGLPIDVQRNYQVVGQMAQKEKTKHFKVCPSRCLGLIGSSPKDKVEQRKLDEDVREEYDWEWNKRDEDFEDLQLRLQLSQEIEDVIYG